MSAHKGENRATQFCGPGECNNTLAIRLCVCGVSHRYDLDCEHSIANTHYVASLSREQDRMYRQIVINTTDQSPGGTKTSRRQLRAHERIDISVGRARAHRLGGNVSVITNTLGE